jgi:hypothetical protein
MGYFFLISNGPDSVGDLWSRACVSWQETNFQPLLEFSANPTGQLETKNVYTQEACTSCKIMNISTLPRLNKIKLTSGYASRKEFHVHTQT